MIQISINKITSALYEALTHPLTLMILCGIAIYAAYKIITTRAQSTSITKTISSFYQLMGKGKWSQVWNNLTPDLQNLLLDENREAISTRGYTGTGQLKSLAATYSDLFRSPRPVLISKHRVPNTTLGIEMLMIHTRNHAEGHGITFWLARKVHSQGYWMIEEVLVHPMPGTPSYTLSGKRFVPPKSSQKSPSEKPEEFTNSPQNQSEVDLNQSVA